MAEMNFKGKSERLETIRALETVPAGNKPPWRPKVPGYVALILGRAHWWQPLASVVWVNRGRRSKLCFTLCCFASRF
jgi:hypothetical protein